MAHEILRVFFYYVPLPINNKTSSDKMHSVSSFFFSLAFFCTEGRTFLISQPRRFFMKRFSKVILAVLVFSFVAGPAAFAADTAPKAEKKAEAVKETPKEEAGKPQTPLEVGGVPAEIYSAPKPPTKGRIIGLL